MLWDTHMHCAFSGDSDADPELMIQSAIEKQLDGICFTDHLDYDYPEEPELFLLDFPAYQGRIFSLKEKYKKVILVANLPYYITTQIIEKVLTECKIIDEIVVMVQKEVALKYTSDYKSPLTFMIQDMGKIEYMFTVSQNVFIPAPHVDSAILKITIDRPADLNLYKVLNSAFKQKRKTIYNNLKNDYQDVLDVLNENQIDQKLRCEQLTLEDYKALTKSFYKHTI